ncbi:hypothetical protein [Streptomyces toxytricini]|uniref:hypothetical protein n=1 Tax=Streptomyces toxytricini TaxID=67369 RepID=UPI0034163934
MSALIRGQAVPGNPLYAHIRVQDSALEGEEVLDTPSKDALTAGEASVAIWSPNGTMGFEPLVSLELWNGEPPPAGPSEAAAGEADLLVRSTDECPQGAVTLHALTLSPYGPLFPLDGAGTYRVRVLRRDGEGFRVQMWHRHSTSARPGRAAAS